MLKKIIYLNKIMKYEFQITLKILKIEKENIINEINKSDNIDIKFKLIEKLTYIDDKIKKYNKEQNLNNKKGKSNVY